jgi:uncharacterized protein with GYD domain
VEAARVAVSSLGGTVESFYFAFGEDDAYITVDLPDNVAAAALGVAVCASGMVDVRTIVLLTPEEMDRAAKVKVTYRAPGAAAPSTRRSGAQRKS